MLEQLRKELENHANPQKAKVLRGFFKTGKGEYGEGDIFLGVTVPTSRRIAQQYQALSFTELKELLASPIHEERLIALLILVHNFIKGSDDERKAIYDFYLKSTKYINNWDLVDLSADKIVGDYLFDKPKDVLKKLACSNNLWERRIAIVATYHFIKNNEFAETLHLAELLLHDSHDLIHKAVGWMLREVGKRSQEAEEAFLKEHYKAMPRTMLRYAIERFPKELQRAYLQGKVEG